MQGEPEGPQAAWRREGLLLRGMGLSLCPTTRCHRTGSTLHLPGGPLSPRLWGFLGKEWRGPRRGVQHCNSPPLLGGPQREAPSQRLPLPTGGRCLLVAKEPGPPSKSGKHLPGQQEGAGPSHILTGTGNPGTARSNCTHQRKTGFPCECAQHCESTSSSSGCSDNTFFSGRLHCRSAACEQSPASGCLRRR